MAKFGVISVSYVGEINGWQGGLDWGQMMDMYAAEWNIERLENRLAKIKSLGFDYIELYKGDCGFGGWGDESVDEILALFDKLELNLISFCPGGLRGTAEEIEPYFQFGDALGVDMLSGTMGREPELVDITAELCNKYGKKYAIEPHGKTSTLCDPNEILAAIERYPDVLGACPDSGWFEKEGFNAVQAFEILKNVTLHTHLKGFKSTTGRACTPGDGDINMDTIVRTLRDTGYDGVWSIEWEAPYDPSDDLARSLKYVKGILAE